MTISLQDFCRLSPERQAYLESVGEGPDWEDCLWDEEPAPVKRGRHERRDCPRGEDGCADCLEERTGSAQVQRWEDEGLRFDDA